MGFWIPLIRMIFSALGLDYYATYNKPCLKISWRTLMHEQNVTVGKACRTDNRDAAVYNSCGPSQNCTIVEVRSGFWIPLVIFQ